MNTSEFAIIAQTLKKAYNRHHFMEDPEEASVWFEMLNDLDGVKVAEAVKYYVQTDTTGFPPVIGQIRKAVLDASGQNIDGWEQAWNKTVRAIRKYGFYREDEALASLDTLTRDTVKYYGYQDLCRAEEGDATVKAQFRDIYRHRANNMASYLMLEGIKDVGTNYLGAGNSDICV